MERKPAGMGLLSYLVACTTFHRNHPYCFMIRPSRWYNKCTPSEAFIDLLEKTRRLSKDYRHFIMDSAFCTEDCIEWAFRTSLVEPCMSERVDLTLSAKKKEKYSVLSYGLKPYHFRFIICSKFKINLFLHWIISNITTIITLLLIIFLFQWITRIWQRKEQETNRVETLTIIHERKQNVLNLIYI